MSTESTHPALNDQKIPLCFDTSAIFGKRYAVSFLRSVRKHFPERTLFIPVWVVAQRVRQLQLELGSRFDPAVIQHFLKDEELRLELLIFDEHVVLDGWLKVVGRFKNEKWAWEERPLPQGRRDQPCSERCRVGDHIVYALARTYSALLVTEDEGLLRQVQSDGTEPGAVHAHDLKVLLGLV